MCMKLHWICDEPGAKGKAGGLTLLEVGVLFIDLPPG